MLGDVAVSLIELQTQLIGAESVDGFLTGVAALAVARVGIGLSCGITLRPVGLPAAAVSTDSLAAGVDEVRYGLAHGPCQYSMRTGTPVLITDSGADGRWTGYRTRAAACGVRSSLSLPVGADGRVFGVVGLYSRRTGTFDAAVIERAAGFVGIATGALAATVRIAEQIGLTAQLRNALASRPVIDQAVGILMAQRRCPAAEAFAILSKSSQDRNVKARMVAARIVAATGGADAAEAWFDPPAAPRGR
ncbi:GAF and ANTAR domain-containing protein [Catenulispora yoronensis]|uniref:GAF and ANTAR domain-containing protein n=1 Tax=Catenulispora yoronensis TaxID=450799 RepID=A0ABN2TTX7_9ACTN